MPCALLPASDGLCRNGDEGCFRGFCFYVSCGEDPDVGRLQCCRVIVGRRNVSGQGVHSFLGWHEGHVMSGTSWKKVQVLRRFGGAKRVLGGLTPIAQGRGQGPRMATPQPAEKVKFQHHHTKGDGHHSAIIKTQQAGIQRSEGGLLGSLD
jgi:hypothetical protein